VLPPDAGKRGMFPSACVIVHGGSSNGAGIPPPPADSDEEIGAVEVPLAPLWDPSVFPNTDSEAEEAEVNAMRNPVHKPVRI
jgi:hypothetical protein